MTRIRLFGPVLLALVAVVAVSASSGQVPPPAEWRTFDGTWSASGQRQTLPTEAARPAATVQMSGAVSLTVTGGLSHGFRGEVLGFDDGTGLVVGRAVWTDDRGDQVFARLTGGPLASGRRVTGTISGGTGRYAGISGEFSFEWQYVVEAEGGEIHGRATGLHGRVRIGAAR